MSLKPTTKKALAIVEKRQSEPANDQPAQGQLPLVLPPWSPDRRAMPKAWAQSALFVVHDKRKPRENYTNAPIFVVGGAPMTYTGQELREEDDKLVWLQAVQFGKAFALGEWVQFTYYDMVKALKWPNTTFYYQRVHDCLLRMRASAVAMRLDDTAMEAVSFIKEYQWDSKKGDEAKPGKIGRVRLDPRMVKLFANNWTEVTWDAYLELSPLARRIYDYACCHREPHALRLETLRKMVGSENDARERRWAERVRDAAAELTTAGMVQVEVRDGLLHFHSGRIT